MRKRDLFILIGALCAALGMGLYIMLGQVLETGSWGLSYRTEGQPPEGPASGAELAQ